MHGEERRTAMPEHQPPAERAPPAVGRAAVAISAEGCTSSPERIATHLK